MFRGYLELLSNKNCHACHAYHASYDLTCNPGLFNSIQVTQELEDEVSLGTIQVRLCIILGNVRCAVITKISNHNPKTHPLLDQAAIFGMGEATNALSVSRLFLTHALSLYLTYSNLQC